MRVRLAASALLEGLAAHVMGRGFLVVRLDRERIDAHPLNSVSDRHDRRLLADELERSRRSHPNADPAIE